MHTPHTPDLQVDIKNHVAHLTLNRPQALNSLTHGMVKAMAALFTQWATDPAIHAVVMRGAGEKSFCAGGDIRALRESAITNSTMHHDFFIDEYRLDYQLHRFPKPIVCLLDGIVMGGGMGIAQGARFRIVGPKTKMAMPETGIGLFPDVGGSYFLSRSPIGLYLGLTGQVIKAADALYAKLADCFMSGEAITALLGKLDSVAWSATPANDIATLVTSLASAPAEASTVAPLQAAIDHHFAPEHSVADMIQSLESEPRTELQAWSQHTAKVLSSRAPTLLEVTREQLNRGRRMSLADCFRMELGIVYHCFVHGDLMEGIRAVIIDKDNQPKWQPPTLATLNSATVSAFFAPRWLPDTHPLQNLELLFG